MPCRKRFCHCLIHAIHLAWLSSVCGRRSTGQKPRGIMRLPRISKIASRHCTPSSARRRSRCRAQRASGPRSFSWCWCRASMRCSTLSWTWSGTPFSCILRRSAPVSCMSAASSSSTSWPSSLTSGNRPAFGTMVVEEEVQGEEIVLQSVQSPRRAGSEDQSPQVPWSQVCQP